MPLHVTKAVLTVPGKYLYPVHSYHGLVTTAVRYDILTLHGLNLMTGRGQSLWTAGDLDVGRQHPRLIALRGCSASLDTLPGLCRMPHLDPSLLHHAPRRASTLRRAWHS